MTDAIATLTAHAKVLREGGAPHQQDLAQAIEDVLKITADPAAQIAAAHTLLADRDRHLVESTAKHDRATAAIQRVTNEREQVRGVMQDAVAARDEAVRHRDEAQKERDVAIGQVKASTDRINDLEATLVAVTKERDDLAKDLAAAQKTGIATTKGETHADLKAKSKGQSATTT